MTVACPAQRKAYHTPDRLQACIYNRFSVDLPAPRFSVVSGGRLFKDSASNRAHKSNFSGVTYRNMMDKDVTSTYLIDIKAVLGSQIAHRCKQTRTV
jgi:hypothetical protein